jgi:hypothetical protein
VNISARTLRHAIAAALVFAPLQLVAQGPVSTGTTAPGTVDPVWYVVNPGEPVTLADAFVLSRGNVPGSYSWIAVSTDGSLPGGQPDGNFGRFTYIFETTFTGGGITGATYQCAYDDALVSVMLNGQIAPGAGCDQYSTTNDFTLTGFNTGTNVLRFTSSGNGVTDGLMVHFTSLAGDVTATPEPASIVLLATGLVGVFGAVRRKRFEGPGR